MALALADLATASAADLAQLSTEELARLLAEGTETLVRDGQDWPIYYYRCANPMAEAAHYSTAREVCLAGGNRSGKSTTMLAEMVIQATGVIPEALKAKYPVSKIPKRFRGRVVGPSFTNWLEPVLKPKLRCEDWNGVGDPIDGQGHWGFIPRQLRRRSTWETAWNEKTHTLHIARDSSHLTGGVLTELREWGTLQVMGNHQELAEFAGSSLTFVGHDEVPKEKIYRENQLRTLDVNGQIWTAFTPPDEIADAQEDASWFYDRVYEPGLPGPTKHPLIDSFTIFTEANRILSPQTIEDMRSRLTAEQIDVRLYGRFLHLSGAVYKSWTPYEALWCFRCRRRSTVPGPACPHCASDDTCRYSHVIPDFEIPKTWPILFAIDPHERRPSQCAWFAITPSDDVLVVGELAPSVADGGGVGDVVRQIREYEAARGWRPVKRVGDPNMLQSTNHMIEQGWTMRRAFDREHFRIDLAATDSMPVGVDRVREYLLPDPRTRRPRLQAFASCVMTNNAMGKWSFGEWRTSGAMRAQKETYAEKWKDPCDCVRYALVTDLRFQTALSGAAPIRVAAAGGRY